MERKSKKISVADLRQLKDILPINEINFLPPAGYLHQNKELMDRVYDPEESNIYFPPLPYAGINGYFVNLENSAFLDDMEETFRLYRLRRIKQLSLLHGVSTIGGTPEFLEGFQHTRNTHSFDVMAVSVLLAQNVGLSKEDAKILQIAAFSHDYRTPAGGDTTKSVDGEAFDEDKHYNEIFSTEGWVKFKEKYKISKEQEDRLYQTILGQGILGQLLDLSDKIAYVSQDLNVYLNLSVRMEGPNGESSDSFKRIKNFFNTNPLAGSIWDVVKVVDGRVVVSDSERLTDFLKMRAILWKYLYENFQGGFSKSIFAKRLIEYLYKRGDLTKEELLKTGDLDLYQKLAEFSGSKTFPDLIWHLKTFTKSFSTEEEAKNFAKGFNEDSAQIAIIDRPKMSSIGSTKKFLVETDNGIKPFNEAFPERAKEIEEVMHIDPTFNVHVVSLKDLGVPESHTEKIKSIFEIRD
ncbi:MAG: hypothetical protein KBC06_01730 [Candidatus Pacebacteria bacterium]|nr:hypothetical protein [Candidatus Paceibacterota bacterium]